ncbi:S26 family signal peptidase [Brevundimonas sp.]|uniref:S26 family signal peptidase n=1 Tax=Brevundimonas sp. TaxID=1871086 RepID=UPI00286A3F88|nr:S26 family signal peptidase [Brevundimonas sp.]
MTSPLDNGNRWPALGVVVFVLGCAAAVADRTPALALVNESPSLPRGLYLREIGAAPERGATVALPQPPAARAYLGALGMPPQVLLIKRVAAIEGDLVCRERAAVTAAGRTAPVVERDRRGGTLPQWRGCRRLGRGELFVLGDTPGSFDSRYFGPVEVEDLDGVFREILTW